LQIKALSISNQQPYSVKIGKFLGGVCAKVHKSCARSCDWALRVRLSSGAPSKKRHRRLAANGVRYRSWKVVLKVREDGRQPWEGPESILCTSSSSGGGGGTAEAIIRAVLLFPASGARFYI